MKDDKQAVPIAERDALTYAEVEALGYCSSRQLRSLVVQGVIRRAVLRIGSGPRAGCRFLRTVLIEELQAHAAKRRKRA